MDNQLSVDKTDSFSLSKGTLLSLDEFNLKIFKDNWREYFQNSDERHCTIFQKLNNKEMIEGADGYLPLFFNKKSNFFNLFESYQFYRLNEHAEQINKYNNFIEERYLDENIDSQRPILKPSDMFINQNEISNSLTNISLIEPLTNYKEFKFESFDDAIEQLSNKEKKKKKTILLTSINSEYELLLNKYLPNISQINSVKDAKNGVNLILGNVVRPLINLITSVDVSNYLSNNELNEINFISKNLSFHKETGKSHLIAYYIGKKFDYLINLDGDDMFYPNFKVNYFEKIINYSIL